MQPEQQLAALMANSPNNAASTQLPAEEPTTELSSSDKLIQQFEGIATQFETLNRLYPGNEEKFRVAITAMADWLSSASGSLNIPSNGGSATGVGNTPAY